MFLISCRRLVDTQGSEGGGAMDELIFILAMREVVNVFPI